MCILEENRKVCHNDRVVIQYNTHNSTNCIPWPAQFPRLEHIKNLWWKNKYSLCRRVPMIATREKLCESKR